jgi:ADP-ribose pyrophosphatase YjhB (NUDIX family)
MRHKVVVLVYYNDKENETVRILTGMESYYCFEESNDAIYNERLRQFETCTPEEASTRAKELSERFQRTIQYGDFINNRTHFCCLTTNSHLGVIKGDVFENERFIHAIQRELREETGLIVPESRFLQRDVPFSHHHTSIYFVPLRESELYSIENYFTRRKNNHCGELFDLAFRDLLKEKEEMNHITRCAVAWMGRNPTFPECNECKECNECNECNECPHLIKDIHFEDIRDADPAKSYDAPRIIEPPFKRGVKRYSLLPF